MQRVLQMLRLGAELLFMLLTAIFLVADGFGLRQVQAPNSDQGVRWAVFAAVALVVFVVLVYWRIFQQHGEIQALRSTQANLEVSTHKETIGGSDWHRICVHNASKTVQAQDVVVKVQRINPDPLSLNPYPAPLGIKGGLPNWINPGDDLLFDFVQDRKAGLYRLWTVEFQGQEFTLDDQEYAVTVTISASNANLKTKTFRLRQPFRRDEKNFLRLDGDLEFSVMDSPWIMWYVMVSFASVGPGAKALSTTFWGCRRGGGFDWGGVCTEKRGPVHRGEVRIREGLGKAPDSGAVGR
jgi:hypothetical protein